MQQATDRIIDCFAKINQIPRCSGREAKLCRWLQQWAQARGLEHRTDTAGNLVIRVPASGGAANAPTVVLQGHMDMVCEKCEGSEHDFATDPIRMVVEGPWLRAEETTLGADNGMAIALALALVEDRSISHPPLELLFTVEEETGLNGALKLDPALISGKILINLDSEAEGVIVVGCAGGRDTEIERPLSMAPLDKGHALVSIVAEGMQGGHSGVDIGRHRANANQVMARLLSAVVQIAPARLVSLKGGTGRNVIPRACEAALACSRDAAADVERAIRDMGGVIRREYRQTDADLDVKIEVGDGDTLLHAVTEADTRAAIDLLLALPTGPVEMTPDHPALVQTSTNLALVKIDNALLSVVTSQRSAVPSRLDAICQRVRATGRLAGARVQNNTGYPSWPMNPDSALLQRCKTHYRELFGGEPVAETIHAGLECGVIGDRCPGLDMISIGPTVENLHSPSERLHLPSVERIWQLLSALLAGYVDEKS